uniref:Uncharacterized protein n=1 Tax=Takifugu rubripes TaxID=31033 RepID=A0A674NFU1_TAKRU
IHHYQGRAGDEDQLQSPETDVGDGEDVVVADVGTTRLEGKKHLTGRVAHEILALVTPDPLCCHHKHQHTEHKHHGQPDSPKGRGVFVDSTEKALQPRPVHPCCCCPGPREESKFTLSPLAGVHMH